MKARIRKRRCEFQRGNQKCWTAWIPGEEGWSGCVAHFDTWQEAITYAMAGLVEATP